MEEEEDGAGEADATTESAAEANESIVAESPPSPTNQQREEQVEHQEPPVWQSVGNVSGQAVTFKGNERTH